MATSPTLKVTSPVPAEEETIVHFSYGEIFDLTVDFWALVNWGIIIVQEHMNSTILSLLVELKQSTKRRT